MAINDSTGKARDPTARIAIKNTGAIISV